MAMFESSPLWDVDCFSLSARLQVRWRERRRCDCQTELPVEEKPMKQMGNDVASPTSVAFTTRRDSNGIKHAQILIKRNDSSYDFNQYQTQC